MLENRNLTVRGLLMDADPFGFTQGEIIDLNHDDLAITVQLFDGYPTVHDRKERIEFFTPEGVMLPHRQDAIQVCFPLQTTLPALPGTSNVSDGRLGARKPRV